MSQPVQVDIPHELGAAEAKRRIDGGMGRLGEFVPGTVDVRSAWSGDVLGLQVNALGQEVNARIDVRDAFVRVELLLPPALAFLTPAIEAALRRKGGDLLEDRSGRRG